MTAPYIETMDREIDGLPFTFLDAGKCAYTVFADGHHVGSIRYQGGWQAASDESCARTIAEWGKGNHRAHALVGPFNSIEAACRFLLRESHGPLGNKVNIDGRKLALQSGKGAA